MAARRPADPVTPQTDHPVPSRPFKLDGLPPDTLNELIRQLPGVTWLIEADGAKGCGLKIHAEHEPVIPSGVTTAVVMAHLDVLGGPLDGRRRIGWMMQHACSVCRWERPSHPHSLLMYCATLQAAKEHRTARASS